MATTRGPLRRIRALSLRSEKGEPPTREDLDAVWADMNSAICILLGCHSQASDYSRKAIEEFLDSEEE
jgi:hypothetical protein